MWLRNKHTNGRWADWNWEPKLTLDKLLRIRDSLQESFKKYIETCEARGETLVRSSKGELIIEAPLGFTPNDFVRRHVQEHPDGGTNLVNLFTIRFFFQSVQIGQGDFASGPQVPFRVLKNVLRKELP